MNAKLQTLTIDRPQPFENGTRLPRLRIGYRTWGRPDRAAGNGVLVCPALTGDSDLEKWWPGLLGPGRTLDPDTDFIVCADVLGGCGETSGPRTRRSHSRRWGHRFPAIGVRDMVAVQKQLLDHLGIDRLKLVVGGSLGGMQALEWAAGYPDRIAAAVVIAAPARQSAWARSLNHAQRRALETHGDLALARMIAMLSYRHWDNLDGRFGQAQALPHPACEWLDHHGRSLSARFDPVSYERLMTAMDGHDVGRSRGGWQAALGTVDVEMLIVGITSDLLYPPSDQQRLAESLSNASLAWLEADQGHDAFLIEQERLDRLIARFRRQIDSPARSTLEACS